MPRRPILSVAERESLQALPESKEDLIRHYTFNEAELSIIGQRRGTANRRGFAVQLCYMRHPGITLAKMDESCPGTTYAKLAWLQAWHIRDQTYSTALAKRVNAQFRHPFAEHWGDGTTSSSDGTST